MHLRVNCNKLYITLTCNVINLPFSQSQHLPAFFLVTNSCIYHNFQVVTKSEFNFTKAKIFQNVTIAAWDPGKYNGTLKDWLSTADFDIFTNYKVYRQNHPNSKAYLIDPHSIWRLWQGLQTFTQKSIRKNPPSSGFIGLALLLPHCPYIDFIEYIPSTRLTGRCHYYSKEVITEIVSQMFIL